MNERQNVVHSRSSHLATHSFIGRILLNAGSTRRCYVFSVPVRRHRFTIGPFLLASSCTLLTACLQPKVQVSVPVLGNHTQTFTRIGPQFVFSENSELAIDEAGLTTYRTEGRNYVRWTFSVRPKTSERFRSVLVEDVTGAQPIMLVNDRAPQVGEVHWTGQSALIRATADQLPWLFDNAETMRVFRITVRFANGKTSYLYQPTRFTAKSKEDLLGLMGPEIPGSG